KSDIDPNLFVKIGIDVTKQIPDISILGYDDLLRLSKSDEFKQIFVKSLKESLENKKTYYLQLLMSTEAVDDRDMNDISSKLSCNNNIIKNAEDILFIIDGINLMIDEDRFDIDNRLEVSIKLLNKIVGRNDLKDIISRDIIVFARSQKVFCSNFNNMVIYGPPGCGKSYCVGIIDKIYSILGITLRPSKEIKMEDLGNAFKNESSRQTRRTFLDGLERVLFLDEAYILSKNNEIFGSSNNNDVITTIVQFLSEYEGKVTLIVAGYYKEMKAFLKANDGFDRRFPSKRRMSFDSYSSQELTKIFINRVSDVDPNIRFEGISVSHLYSLIDNQHDKFENGAGDISNMCREFVQFSYLSKSGSWRSGNYDNNSTILNDFFGKYFGETYENIKSMELR